MSFNVEWNLASLTVLRSSWLNRPAAGLLTYRRFVSTTHPCPNSARPPPTPDDVIKMGKVSRPRPNARGLAAS